MAAIFPLVLSFSSQAGNKPPFSADTLQQWITIGTSFDFLLIDVTNVGEFNKVIATENCRPYQLPWGSGDNTSVFIQTKSKLPKDTTIVLYCASGNRSGKAKLALDSDGFGSVYSLPGGISNWTGSVKPVSYIKPTADLPAPSMLKNTAIAFKGLDISVNKQFTVHFNNGNVSLAAPFFLNHCLSIFDSQGRCVLKKQNPFFNRTCFYIAENLGNRLYIMELRGGKTGNAQTVVKVQ